VLASLAMTLRTAVGVPALTVTSLVVFDGWNGAQLCGSPVQGTE